MRHFLYNPLRQDPKELEQLFVARRPLFEHLHQTIRAQPSGSIPQHHLIIGQRGMGKTTMLARLALELRNNDADFLPLSFWEEQHIEIDRASVFWLNCLDSLADALDRSGDVEQARQLDKRIAEIQHVSPEEECARLARDSFACSVEKISRRLVLFIDNFNLLLSRLKKHDHALRSFFTRHGAPIIVGAAISPPVQLSDYDFAFYDGFRTTLLNRLSIDEIKDMIVRLAEANDQPEAIRNLWREFPRLAALRDLSGGNPRTSLLIYRLCVRGLSADIYRDLESLLDETTPLFQSRFEQMSEQGQKLVARLARHWRPATAETITGLTDFARSTVSPLLGRLEDEGIVEQVPLFDPNRFDDEKRKRGSISKKMGYQLTERFFNIWIIMRSASRRERSGIVCLSRFLESMYTPAERANWANALSSLSTLSWEQAIGARALTESADHSELRIKAETTLLELAKRGAGELEGLIDPDSIGSKARKLVELKELLRQAVPQSARTSPDDFAALVMGSMSNLVQDGLARNVISDVENSRLKNVDIAAASLREEASDFAKHLGEHGAQWLRQKVQNGVLTSVDNLAEIQETINSATDPGALVMLGEIGGRFSAEIAKSAYLRAIQNNSEYGEAWARLGPLEHASQNFAAARTAYERAIALGIEAPSTYANYAQLLAIELGELNEAEKWFRKASTLDPRSSQIANNLGACLWFKGGKENAAAAIKEFRRAGELDWTNPKPWISIGMIQHQVLREFGSAATSFRKAIGMSKRSSTARTHLAFVLLEGLKDPAEAEEQFRKALDEGEADVSCLLGLAGLLSDYKRDFVESEKTYRRAIELDPKSDLAWSGLGVLQATCLRDFTAAKHSFSTAVELAPGNARHHNSLGNLLYDHFDQFDAAESHFLKAIQLDPKEDSPRHNYAFLLRDTQGNPKQAEIVLSSLANPDQWKDTQALHRALTAAYKDNWGDVVDELKSAIAEIQSRAFPKNTYDDWCRASAVLLKLGLGEKLTGFLESEGCDVAMLPWFAALEAHNIGSRQMLFNCPSEAREAAYVLFDDILKRLRLVNTPTLKK